MRYRTLKVGDVRREGDEFVPKGGSFWIPANFERGKILRRDLMYNSYRRPLREKEKNTKMSEAKLTAFIPREEWEKLRRVYALAREYVSACNEHNKFFCLWSSSEELNPFLSAGIECGESKKTLRSALNAEFLKEGTR